MLKLVSQNLVQAKLLDFQTCRSILCKWVSKCTYPTFKIVLCCGEGGLGPTMWFVHICLIYTQGSFSPPSLWQWYVSSLAQVNFIIWNNHSVTISYVLIYCSHFPHIVVHSFSVTPLIIYAVVVTWSNKIKI